MRRPGQLEEYTSTVRIRRRAGRRDARIAGAVFLVVVIAAISYGLLRTPNARSVYLMAALLIGLGLSFVMAWVKLEVATRLLELMDHLRRADGEHPG